MQIINKKKRAFNGIKYNQIVEVSKENLEPYLRAWFEIFKTQKTKKVEKESQEKLEKTNNKFSKKELQEELKKADIKFAWNSSYETLLKKYKQHLKQSAEDKSKKEHLLEKLKVNGFTDLEGKTLTELEKIIIENKLN